MKYWTISDNNFKYSRIITGNSRCLLGLGRQQDSYTGIGIWCILLLLDNISNWEKVGFRETI